MSLGNLTITVTIDGVAKVLKRINNDNFSTQYYLHEATQEFTVNIRHSREALMADGRQYDRHNVELIHTIFATEASAQISRTAYIVTRNLRSDDYMDVADDVIGLLTFAAEPTTVDDLLTWVS